MSRNLRLSSDVELMAIMQRMRSPRSEMREAESAHRVNSNQSQARTSDVRESHKLAQPGSTPGPASPPAAYERDIQRAILEMLHLHPAVAWCARMNTGVADFDGRRVAFAFRGCPDIIGQLKGGRLLAIEVKRADGRMTEDQLAFLSRAARHGAFAFVARSVDDVLEMLAGRPAA